MRGDRPGRFCSAQARPSATPHARGSTCLDCVNAGRALGYPACAGIDQHRRIRSIYKGRLPRMRGDRPDILSAKAQTGQATPHARGSTWPSPPYRGSGSGYPACAGIDPAGRCCSWQSRRLPRMRGDRPVAEAVVPKPGKATPHARGSTQVQLQPAPEQAGYPACAGIDLRRGLPRMRGDRPLD